MDTVKWYEDTVYIKMCEKAEEIQGLWQEIDVARLPSFCYDKEIDRVCIFLWSPDTLVEKVGVPESNSLLVSIEWDKPLHHWTPEVLWKGGNTIWLPRQDQLQEMLINYLDIPIDELHLFIYDFYLFIDCDCIKRVGDYRLREFKSMEQLWLAFCMQELYGKVWSGDKWLTSK